MAQIQYINPLLLMNQDSEWINADPIVKGFHFQLLSISANDTNKGTITANDETLRKILNIPIPWAIKPLEHQKNDPVIDFLQKTFDGQHLSSVMLDMIKAIFSGERADFEGNLSLRISHEEWTNYLWIYVWKPQLLKFWTPVDSKVTRKYPDLKDFKDLLWNETAHILSKGFDINQISQTANPVKKSANKKAKKEELPDIAETPYITTVDDLGYNGIAWLHGDTTNYRDLSKNLRAWRKPIPVNETQDMWEVGVRLLSQNPQDLGKSRKLLGKLISQHGDKVVAKAVAELATQTQYKSTFNRQALLIGIIKRETEGTPAEIKAREARAKLTL